MLDYECILECAGLSKAFGGVVACRAIDLSLSRGEIIGLFGPNGAGKTTFINLLSGLEVADRGDIWLLGVRVTHAKLFKRTQLGLGRHFQAADLYASLTVRETIDLHGSGRRLMPGLGQRGRGGADRGLAFLKRVGLGDRFGSRNAELSGGQKQLVSFAALVATEPVLWLLDEPTVGLKPGFEELVLEELCSAVRNGAAAVIVEHNLNFLQRACEKFMYLEGGEKVAEGPDLLDRPELLDYYAGTRYRPKEFLEQ